VAHARNPWPTCCDSPLHRGDLLIIKDQVNKRKIAPSPSKSLWEPHVLPGSQLKRRILRDGAKANAERDEAFRRAILSIPAGKVSTYGKVAAAAGYPLYHRAVARLLRTDPPDLLPWHRVLGAGGEIKLRHQPAKEQRQRLQLEGVKFLNKRVDMEHFEHTLRTWETFD
jgi:methylated-DNA-protein-cysteine methyltransferase-like protein